MQLQNHLTKILLYVFMEYLNMFKNRQRKQHWLFLKNAVTFFKCSAHYLKIFKPQLKALCHNCFSHLEKYLRK